MSSIPLAKVLFLPACVHLRHRELVRKESLVNPLLKVDVWGCAKFGRCTLLDAVEGVKHQCGTCPYHEPVMIAQGQRRLIAVY